MDVNNVEVNAGPIAGVPFFIESEPVSFRPIDTNDFHIIKELHELFFPIKYDDAFYEKICTGTAVVGKGRLFSSLAVFHGEVIGFVLGQFIDYPARCEDKGMFSADREPKTVFYILTLGLVEKYRRTGLGSKLIQQCEDFANLDWECGAVYLHVITYNTSAIRFYRKNNYTELRCISEFYHFDNKYHDSYLYVRYLNNYKAPLQNRVWSTASYFLDASIGYVTSLFSFFNPIATFSSIFPAQDRAHKLADIENEEKRKKYNSAPASIVCKDGVCSIDIINNDAIESSEGSEMNV